MSDISARLRDEVVLLAGNRSEYRGLWQVGQKAAFHVDQVLPRVAGGLTEVGNLALACVSCSLRSCALVQPAWSGLEGPLPLGWSDGHALDADGSGHGGGIGDEPASGGLHPVGRGGAGPSPAGLSLDGPQIESALGSTPATVGLPLILAPSVAIIEVSNHSSEESPAIPKRIPPSQRPERKLDDVARAIASQVEETKAAKSADHGRASSADLQANGSSKGIIKPANAQPSVPTMKRRKTGGG